MSSEAVRKLISVSVAVQASQFVSTGNPRDTSIYEH